MSATGIKKPLLGGAGWWRGLHLAKLLKPFYGFFVIALDDSKVATEITRVKLDYIYKE